LAAGVLPLVGAASGGSTSTWSISSYSCSSSLLSQYGSTGSQEAHSKDDLQQAASFAAAAAAARAAKRAAAAQAKQQRKLLKQQPLIGPRGSKNQQQQPSNPQAAAAATVEPGMISPDHPAQQQQQLQVLPAITTIKGLYDNLLAQSVEGWSLQMTGDTLQCCYKVQGLSLRICFFLGPPAPLTVNSSAAGSSKGRLVWQHSCEVQSPATGEWLLVDTAGRGWWFADKQLLVAKHVVRLLKQYARCCMCAGCSGSQHAAISRARGHLWRDSEGTTHASFEEGRVLTSRSVITSTLRAECCVQLMPPHRSFRLGTSHKKRKRLAETRWRCGPCNLLRMRLKSMQPRMCQKLQAAAAAGGQGAAMG
jgi:hypothetical protein